MEVLVDPQSSCASDWINSTITHDSNDTKVILHTVKVYGLVFVLSLLSFCALRQWFPRVYNIRNWVDKYQTPLAADPRGWLSWMWKLLELTETELRDECGLDALCYRRIFDFGIQLSAVGVFHALWLMPVYGTESSAPLINDNDPIATVSISNLPAGSKRFIATVVAAYCIFFSVMYLVQRELEWFTRTRHEFLTLVLPRNYTVYVQSVPEELRNNEALRHFFQEGFSPNTVLSAQLALTVGNLKALQKKRSKVLDSLQRAIDQRSNDSTVNTHDAEMERLYRELDDFNRAVSQSIDEIEQRGRVSGDPTNHQQTLEATADASQEGTWLLDEDEKEMDPETNVSNDNIASRIRKQVSASLSLDETATSHHSALDAVADTLMEAANTVEEWSELVVRETGRAVLELVSNEDGRVLPSAFVTFTTLRGTHTAMQMVQYPEFYAMKVSEAAQPEDIIWSNIGRPHQELKIFSILSFVLTVSVCFLWTIPMAFIASIANLNGLRAQFHWLDEILTQHPRLEVFFNQLAPLLILMAGQLMYLVAEVFTILEGPISGAVVQSRMFVKLYWFQIIQVRSITTVDFPVVSSQALLSNFSPLARHFLFPPSVDLCLRCYRISLPRRAVSSSFLLHHSLASRVSSSNCCWSTRSRA
jgi:Late exocytosis, associated with Golgi transport/Cytosolic domain of 10TM putative phosphate transporter/Calcium-dependent channel, 7TM region, putative phosphate